VEAVRPTLADDLLHSRHRNTTLLVAVVVGADNGDTIAPCAAANIDGWVLCPGLVLGYLEAFHRRRGRRVGATKDRALFLEMYARCAAARCALVYQPHASRFRALHVPFVGESQAHTVAVRCEPAAAPPASVTATVVVHRERITVPSDNRCAVS
jgi:hypothetical protein